MELLNAASSLRDRTKTMVEGLVRFAKLERILAAVCAFTPFLLIGFDDGPIRSSISAYYNMSEGQMFYVPLTVAVMLFVVNGVVNDGQKYNALLGLLLAGVLMFNQDDWTFVHRAFAATFFIGNVVAIAIFSSLEGWRFRIALSAAIALALVSWFVFEWFTLFWAEWASLFMISVHYIIESRIDTPARQKARVKASKGRTELLPQA